MAEKGGVVDVNELRRDYPQTAIDEYEKAINEAKKGNSEKAARRLERALEIAPDFYQAQNNLGVQYKTLGLYRDAEATFEIAHTLNKNASQPLINLGAMYLEEAQQQISSDQAGQVSNEFGAIIDSFHPDEELALATYRKAITVLEKAIALDEFSPSAKYFLATGLYKSSQLINCCKAGLNRAESLLLAALNLDKDYHVVRLMLVNVYMKLARYKDVLTQLTSFLDGSPDSPEAVAVRAMKDQLEKAFQN